MTKIPRIVNYGVPRSGTTLVQRMFEHCRAHGDNYRHRKLPENDPQHPRQSATGLIEIAESVPTAPVYFVRTLRHPVAVLESECAIKRPAFLEDRAEFDRLVADILTIGQNDAAQAARCPPNARFLRVHFPQLGDRKTVEELFARIGEVSPYVRRCWADFLDQVWEKVPVRSGRLSQGERDTRLLPGSWVELIHDRLDGVIEAEGLLEEPR